MWLFGKSIFYIGFQGWLLMSSLRLVPPSFLYGTHFIDIYHILNIFIVGSILLKELKKVIIIYISDNFYPMTLPVEKTRESCPMKKVLPNNPDIESCFHF